MCFNLLVFKSLGNFVQNFYPTLRMDMMYVIVYFSFNLWVDMCPIKTNIVDMLVCIVETCYDFMFILDRFW